MKELDRASLFDNWAEWYDRSVHDPAFPLSGYERVLDEIVTAACVKKGMSVLDLGVGTGNLASRFAELGCDLLGVDFSAGMLAKARERLPDARLVQADLRGEWPAELERRFDRIVSGYVFHEFPVTTKVHLIHRLVQGHLADGGYIIIGDVSFETHAARESAHERWLDRWDEEEEYWAADEATEILQPLGLKVTYQQVSICGGVFVIKPPELNGWNNRRQSAKMRNPSKR